MGAVGQLPAPVAEVQSVAVNGVGVVTLRATVVVVVKGGLGNVIEGLAIRITGGG